MLNHIALMGRLTRDPERRYTENGTPRTSFTLAVERDFAPKGEEKKADFINCSVWHGTADYVYKYAKKGALVVVSGRLHINSWVDKNGNMRYSPEIVLDNFYFAGGGKSNDTEAEKVPYPRNKPYDSPVNNNGFAELEDEDGDLPF